MLAMLLMFVLIFGGSMSAFAEDIEKSIVFEPTLYVSEYPEDSGIATGNLTQEATLDKKLPFRWVVNLHADELDVPEPDYIFSHWEELKYVWPNGDDKKIIMPIQEWQYFSDQRDMSFYFFEDNMMPTRTFRGVFIPVYKLTVSVDDPDMGGTTGHATGKYLPGTDIAIAADPEEGFRVMKWTYNGDDYSTLSNIDFVMPDEPVDIVLYYEEIPWFDVSGSVDPEDSGTIDGLGSYQVGDEVVLTASPERGYALDEWHWDDEEIDPVVGDGTLTFIMPEYDVHVEADFYLMDAYPVYLEADPEEGGEPFFEGPDYDGMYYPGETFTVDPNPNPNFTFTHWTWYWMCVMPEPIDDDELFVARDLELLEEPNWSDDEDFEFGMGECALHITAHYEEAPFVWVTLEYHDTEGDEVKPDSEPIKLYYGDYSFSPAVIPGWQHIYSTPNASGAIGEGAGDFTITFVYQVPPEPEVVTETVVVTDTVVVTETVFVTVPAPTTETVTEEEVPLAPLSTPIDLDSIYDQTPPPPTTAPAEEIELEEVPLADALPQTGQLPAEGFYGIGGLISAIGVYLKKRSFKQSMILKSAGPLDWRFFRRLCEANSPK